VVRPLRWNREAQDRARALGADVLLSGCFMCLVPTEILDCFGDRAINFHPALLPMYRSADPRAAMILHGSADRFGGVSMHVMSPEFATGDVIAARRVPWGDARCFDGWDLAAGRAAGSLATEELSRYLVGRIVRMSGSSTSDTPEVSSSPWVSG
jgi:methionyl-tRNA formyltransferase